jgi:hypothetical protein
MGEAHCGGRWRWPLSGVRDAAQDAMNTQTLAALVLVSWWPSLLLGQSPPPPPTPSPTTHEEKQQSANQQTSSQQSTETTAKPKVVGKSAKAHRDKTSDKSSTDRWVAAFTGMLTVLGLLQYLAMRKQAHYMRDGLTETSRAADAANTSAGVATKALEHSERAAALTERAIVLIDSISWGPRDNPVLSGIELRTRVTFTLKNFGKTMASKVQMHGGLIPEWKAKSILEVEKLMPTTIAPQGSNSWTVPALQNLLLPAETDSINQSRETLAFHITATYQDSFGKYKYQCTGRFDPVLKRFLISGSETS